MSRAASRPKSRRVAIIGGGFAGLVAAYEVAQHPGCTPVLFEASGRVGGTVETVHESGFTIETGPDSWVSDRPAARELAVELGLAGELIYSNDRDRRNYLAKDNALLPMPDGMRMIVPTRWEPILESPLFSEQARLAYRGEPGRAAELKAEAAARPPDFDESVRSFAHRHFGDEVTETIAGPLLAGVFGGDIDTLSAGAVLAPFVRLEREHGSIIAPTMARVEAERALGREPEPVFTTLRSGLETLVDRLIAALPRRTVRLQTTVAAIAFDGTGWTVTTGAQDPAAFDAVVLATPAHVTRSLLAPLDPGAAALLTMDATSAVVVALCFAENDSAGIPVPRGFGFLAPLGRSVHREPTAPVWPEFPAGEAQPELLAGTFMHQKFPHRAPAGSVFLRGFFGESAAAQVQHWPDDRLAEAARAGFARFLGPLPAPLHTVVRRWPRSLPQYRVGHPARMRLLAERLARLPGLALTGNSYEGVGLPALIGHARAAVRALLRDS